MTYLKSCTSKWVLFRMGIEKSLVKNGWCAIKSNCECVEYALRMNGYNWVYGLGWTFERGLMMRSSRINESFIALFYGTVKTHTWVVHNLIIAFFLIFDTHHPTIHCTASIHCTRVLWNLRTFYCDALALSNAFLFSFLLFN